MANFSVQDAQGWAESSKLPVSAIDNDLARQITNLIFAQLRPTFETSSWANEASTPALVRTILAMYYIAAMYDKYYAQEAEESSYAITLRTLADRNIAGLLAGSITMDDYALPAPDGNPVFFPNDESSAQPASTDFPSFGGPAFTMGSIF